MVLVGRFNTLQMTIAIPKDHISALPMLNDFVAGIKRDGTIADAIKRAGLSGARPGRPNPDRRIPRNLPDRAGQGLGYLDVRFRGCDPLLEPIGLELAWLIPLQVMGCMALLHQGDHAECLVARPAISALPILFAGAGLYLALMALSPLVAVLLLWLMKYLIDEVFVGKNMDVLPSVAGAYIALVVIKLVIDYWSTRVGAAITQEIDQHVRVDL